ncbi:MAG: ATP-binding cassette domain-containing protein, partial [Proteobacteria bacterium]|nr:ATP-binding cassette domain-containing protein [Pseudomonadota bacterium]
MSSNVIIEVKKLTAGYGEKTVLENIDFHVTQGEVFVILGGSGCGKSTLLRQIIGLESP